MATIGTYSIAGLKVEISGNETFGTLDAIPGFGEFACENRLPADIEIQMDREIVRPLGLRPMHSFTAMERIHSLSSFEGGYLFEMRQRDGAPIVAVMHDPRTNEVAMSGCGEGAALKFALWVAFSFVASGKGAIPLHASAVTRDGSAVLFLGESGTGKSTHSRLWLRHIEGCGLLNDDSPVVRVAGSGILACGSPWSGKTDCYRQQSAPLKAMVRLRQGPVNRIERLGALRSIGAIHPSCPPLFACDERLSTRMLGVVGRAVATLPVYEMECRPDGEAAEIAFNAIYRTE